MHCARSFAWLGLAGWVAACGAGNKPCGGTLVTISEEGGTLSQLMAQAAAMGMTTQDAQTLIYLEGLSPRVTLKPGDTICLDGRPDGQ